MKFLIHISPEDYKSRYAKLEIKKDYNRLSGQISADSQISFQIFLDSQSINPPLQECLEMNIYFLENLFDRYDNASLNTLFSQF